MAMPPPAPFIVGVPRSGTTLLRLMLDASPQLAIPAETHHIPRLIRYWRELEEAGVRGDRRRQCIFELITHDRRWPDWSIEQEALRAELERADPLTLADAARAVHVVYAATHQKPRWGDKSTNYLMRMVPIQRALPEACFIHLIRDGRDVALSLATVSWGTADVNEAATKWVERIRKARERSAKLREGTYVELRYEDLVADAQPLLGRICDVIGLEWDDAMLRYHETAPERMREVIRDVPRVGGGIISASERARQHELVTGPPTDARVGRWREVMPRVDRAAFERVAGELLRELGYET